MVKWLLQILSIDEAKISTLIVSLLTILAFDMVMYTIRGDIKDSLVNITLYLITGIVGTAGLNGAFSYYSSKNKSNTTLPNTIEEEQKNINSQK